MKLAAVLLARTIGFVETFDLSPRGKVFYPDLANELVQRYRFQKFPQELSDFDEQKGIEFLYGKAGEEVVERVQIFTNGILVDTRSNTSTSQAILEEALVWAAERFGLSYRPGMIKRYAYISQVSFHSNTPLNALSPALQRLADRLTSAVSEIHGERIEYQTAAVMVQHDPLKRKVPIAGFTIFPRAETPFSERKFFSEAPIPTDLHLELLKDFEAEIQKGLGKSNPNLKS